jgi:hypothetical protein
MTGHAEFDSSVELSYYIFIFYLIVTRLLYIGTAVVEF